MTKGEFHDQIKELLNQASSELSKEEYRDLADTISGDCEERIDALDNDEEEGEENDEEENDD